MPRLGRLHIPGGCYHVMSRGLERRNIFAQKEDKLDFLARLGGALKKNDIRCFAWAVMSNHYHLLLKVGAEPLGKLMGPFLAGYASHYNYRHKRCGYVFQNRFKSILCDENQYLTQLISYIHLNPWKARMVCDLASLDHYPWTGHAGLLGRHVQDWHAIDSVLSLFSDNRLHARRFYREFIAEEMCNPQKNNLSGGGLVRSYGGWDSVQRLRREHETRIGDERILGDSDFVEAVLADDCIGKSEQAECDLQGWTLLTLNTAICRRFDVDEATVVNRGRRNKLSIARQLIAYFSLKVIGISSGEIQTHLKVSQSAISKMVREGQKYCLHEKITLLDLLGDR